MDGPIVKRQEVAPRPLPPISKTAAKFDLWDEKWGVPLAVKDPSKSRLRIVVEKHVNNVKSYLKGIGKAVSAISEDAAFARRETMREGIRQ